MSAETDDDRVEVLAAEVARLRESMKTLQAQVAAARDRIDLTMRGQTRCPACGCRRIMHAREVLDRGDGDMRQKLALAKPSYWRAKVVGEFEVYLCTACGLVEWYAKDLHEVKVDGKIFRIIEGEESGQNGPYR